MKLGELLEHYAQLLADRRDRAPAGGLDAPVGVGFGKRISTVGALHLYAFEVPSDLPSERLPQEDVPLTVLPSDGDEPTEGYVVGLRDESILIQTFDALGQTIPSATLVPDTTAFFDSAAKRLAEVMTKSGAYHTNTAERLLPFLAPDQARDGSGARTAVSSSVLTTIWSDDIEARWMKLATTVVDLVRNNRRLLLLAPDHRSADELTGALARMLKAAGLPFKSLLSRYETAVQIQTAGMPLSDLSFEAQMHQFFAKSRADKATLRRKYERFRELTPLLAYKAEKQRDLDEVKLLEWRLLSHLSDLQGKIKEIDAIVAEYETLPIWKRLAMQTVGKNVQSLAEYRKIYERQIQSVMAELETAKHRIEELAPEAAVPKGLRPEYQELKEEIVRLGGTKKIRELLAAEEGTNRQAFIQNKRVVVTTAARAASDPLFTRVRFDVLMVHDAPFISAPFLLAAACLARERIILSGDTRDLPTPDLWASVPRRQPSTLSDQPPTSALK